MHSISEIPGKRKFNLFRRHIFQGTRLLLFNAWEEKLKMFLSRKAVQDFRYMLLQDHIFTVMNYLHWRKFMIK